jgi:serpin B
MDVQNYSPSTAIFKRRGYDLGMTDGSAFALDLYRRLAAEEKGNIFFSPFSIATAMAMTHAGARGATAAEIAAVMRFGDRVESPGAAYVVANALWAALKIELLPEYVAAMRERFGAEVERLDFERDPDAARATINGWIRDVTRGKVPELIDFLRPDTLVVLTNAIYLKAKWAEPFSPDATDPHGRFRASDGETKAAMMRQTGRFRFARRPGLRLLELPYEEGELSMLIALPDAVDGLPALERDLTIEALGEWEKSLRPARVAVTLPRFRSGMRLELRELLMEMGIRLAFDLDGAADFSGMSVNEKLGISRVIHEARVDVDEEGTEAAAATAVIAIRAAGMIRDAEPERFVADHPFLFLIRDHRTRSILFLGRLARPA